MVGSWKTQIRVFVNSTHIMTAIRNIFEKLEMEIRTIEAFLNAKSPFFPFREHNQLKHLQLPAGGDGSEMKRRALYFWVRVRTAQSNMYSDETLVFWLVFHPGSIKDSGPDSNGRCLKYLHIVWILGLYH